MSKFKSLEKLFYVDINNGMITRVIWWSWKTLGCGSGPDIDTVTTKLSLAETGTRLSNEDKLRVNKALLFKDEEEAREMLEKINELLNN